VFKRYCDYCGKEITHDDYMVHIRYQKFDGTHNEYYHLRCYNKMNKENAKMVSNIVKQLTKHKQKKR